MNMSQSLQMFGYFLVCTETYNVKLEILLIAGTNLLMTFEKEKERNKEKTNQVSSYIILLHFGKRNQRKKYYRK